MTSPVSELAELLRKWPLYISDSGVVMCRAACCYEDPWTPAEAGRRTDLDGLIGALTSHMSKSLTNRPVGEHEH